MAHTTFALSAPSACSATATNGYKGEARAYREKLSKAKPRDSKGVVCRGLPWSCFGQRFYLSDLDELRSQLSCHSTLSLTQVHVTGWRGREQNNSSEIVAWQVRTQALFPEN